MNQIEVGILNPDQLAFAEQMTVAMARLTQRGHSISTIDDFTELFQRPYSDKLLNNLIELPHPTLQKFGAISIVIIGASRRFLAQITRHQNEVKFMSASLQYSDYSGTAQFVVPYEILIDKVPRGSSPKSKPIDFYYDSCLYAMYQYRKLTKLVGNDAAGYAMPQGLRNVLVVSATPYQWKHMISQRTCRRNTSETMYIMLRCWELLLKESKLFANCGPSCLYEGCDEGDMSCGRPIEGTTPTEILKEDFEHIL